MRVLVTGGAGFIGSHVVEALLARGDTPIVLDDLSRGCLDYLPPGLQIVAIDIANPLTPGLVRALRPEAIIHLAAQVSVARSVEDPIRDWLVNVNGTVHVVLGALACGVRRFVFASTGGVYGETTGADEDTAPHPANPYSAHKYLAECLVEWSGLSYAIARLANVYGPRQRADLEGGVIAIFAARLRRSLPVTIFDTGEQRRDFIYVRDVVAALLQLLDSDRCGVWNVGSGRATSINELLALLETHFGRALRRYEPARPGDVRISCLRPDRMRRDFRWEPRYDLASGLAEFLVEQQYAKTRIPASAAPHYPR